MQEATSFSLISGLAEGYAATKLIKDLLQGIDHDVCIARRNSQTSALLLCRACDIYNEINNLIQLAGQDDEDDWENYDKYTAAIGPLQRSLACFDLSQAQISFHHQLALRRCVCSWPGIDSMVA